MQPSRFSLRQLDRRIVLLVVGALALCLLLGFLLLRPKKATNPYTDYVEIANLDRFTRWQKKDDATLYVVQHMLFNTINYNTHPPISTGQVTDALVRDNTFNQSFDKETEIYTVSFVVDIASLQQSYNIQYQWAQQGSGADLDEYGTLISCLDTDRLVYGAFNCRDDLSQESTAPDAIYRFLPHTTLSTRVIAGTRDAEGRLQLKATITLSAAEERGNTAAAIQRHQEQLDSWLRSTGLEPANYIFDYTIIHPSLY